MTDTGVGIAQEERARLFEPFSQTASGRKVHGGTGLGLALSAQYVQIMGGELIAQSAPELGSSFSFSLLLRPVDIVETAVTKGEASVIGREAVETWERWQPHVIFTDMRKPILSGEEATRQIKKLMASRPHGIQSVVAALTASAYEENRHHFLACGCEEFARKPFRAVGLSPRSGSVFAIAGAGRALLHGAAWDMISERHSAIAKGFSW